VKVCVAGLWHLGTVTAACLAAAGHEVTGWDANETTIAALREGRPPIFEPGLAELLAKHPVRFTTDRAEAVSDAEVVWIAYDTPVDEDDNADVELVMREVESLLAPLTRPSATLSPLPRGEGQEGARRADEGRPLVLISSQLPVGTTKKLEQRFPSLHFAYSPENLRLGKAIDVFTNPDRVVVGVRSDEDFALMQQLLPRRLERMSVESAEMTKHALNAFLATSVSFINEIATICEHVGADAKEVERGLKSEQRIGPKAYLGPGAAFAGGTLARDIVFLSAVGREHAVPTKLIDGVKASNDAHRSWAQRRLRELLGDIDGKRVAVWGLTYKPGTDTLRRSSAVELCQWLLAQRARVAAHDPAVRSIDIDGVDLRSDALDAARGADALVVMTEWPEYRQIDANAIECPLVLDANSFLAAQLAANPRIVYATVGKAVHVG